MGVKQAPSRQRDEEEPRGLPSNMEAERSVLGAILVHNDAYETVAEVLKPGQFYRDAHNQIYAAIVALRERRVAVDYVTIKEWLATAGTLDEVGGPAYIASLGDGVPRSTNVTYYAKIVREKWLLRELCFTANRVLSAAYAADDPPEEILRRADLAFLQLQGGTSAARAVPLGESTKSLFADMEWRVEHKGELSGVTTGFTALNEMTFGFQAGDLILLASRPSVGKTMLLANMMVAAARSGTRGVLFSFEMKRRQLEYRFLSSLSGVPLTRILGGYLSAEEYPRISAALEELGSLPIIIDDYSGHTVGDMRARCRRLHADGGLGLVGIDYVQLVPGSLDRRGANRNEELTDISRKTKTTIAEELGVPTIVLSQLKRLDGRLPSLEDLRESGALEQDADIALLLHRKQYRESGPTKVIVAKHRNGPTGTITLDVDLDTVTFRDPPAGHVEEAAEPEPEKPRAPRRRTKT